MRKWKIPVGFEKLPEVTYRNKYAEALKFEDVNIISKKCLGLSLDELKWLLSIANERNGENIEGVGIDLGAGTGLLSVMAAKGNSKIDKIYAIEIVEGFAKYIIPYVSSGILGDQSHKVEPVLGSFDDIELPDDSVDFAIEIHSLHHSHDLHKTLSEIHRVLKPGGKLICFDRSHPDYITEDDKEEMLAKVYSKSFLKENFYPDGVTLTRKENGEREHRESEWVEYFESNGFEIHSTTFIGYQPDWRKIIISGLTWLPSRLKRVLFSKNYPNRRGEFAYEINKMFRNNIVHFRKKYTLFICEKFV